MNSTGPASPSASPLSLADLRVAIVHPFLVSRGGGEKVVDALAELMPHAQVFTMMADPSTFSEAVARLLVHTTWLDRVPGRARFYQYLSPFYDEAVASHDLSGFDLVVSSGGPGAKTVRIPDGAVHVHYCHSPVRFLWDQYETWQARLPPPLRAPFAWSVRAQRRRDLEAAQRVDAIIANSNFISARIERYYKRSSVTIYPPVDLPQVGSPRRADQSDQKGDYYLTVGRLVPGKRTDLLIEACNRMERPLVVVGEGSERERLAALAGPKVTLAGRVSSDELADLFAGARGYLFAAEEDFGIATVEAQSWGLPVIAYARGGTAEIVLDGETGVLFDTQNADELGRAIQRFEAREADFDREAIRRSAQRFSKARFMREMEEALLQRAVRARTAPVDQS